MNTLADDLNHLGLLKRRETILSRRHKEATTARVLHERHVYDRMTDEGYEAGDSSVKLRGVMYIPDSKVYARVQDKDVLLDWLRKHDSGPIETKLMQGELNRLVRAALDNGDQPPPGLGYDVRTTINTRGVNKKQDAKTADLDDEQEDDDGE